MPCLDKRDQARIARAHYERNREEIIARSTSSRQIRKQRVSELKQQPCQDCGGEFPSCVMDYHHRDPTTKVATIGALVKTAGWQTILDEIAKCDLLCANCHRIREYASSGSDG